MVYLNIAFKDVKKINMSILTDLEKNYLSINYKYDISDRYLCSLLFQKKNKNILSNIKGEYININIVSKEFYIRKIESLLNWERV